MKYDKYYRKVIVKLAFIKVWQQRLLLSTWKKTGSSFCFLDFLEGFGKNASVGLQAQKSANLKANYARVGKVHLNQTKASGLYIDIKGVPNTYEEHSTTGSRPGVFKGSGRLGIVADKP
ncbi:hypothetical protein QWY22_19425 [Planococcus liqunii]|uniref:hypothetical protein n=1 Tax=Planococcus liqunii TaxID=3058394 RepID=UPI0026261EA2|nr:hypothetical protein [Planococcus sp. N056]WKA51035.1 hypothetical protein QWY22_19425 [Planococcus sp. N056]